MDDLAVTGPAFVEMAHRIVWATAASVDRNGRPRSRILHPLWQWDGSALVGWIATGPTPVKRADLDHSPYLSITYWTTNHDTCTADCRLDWRFDDDTRSWVWDLFKRTSAGRLRPRHRAGDEAVQLLCCMPVGGQACLEDGTTFTPPWAE